jgi:hypothetical protein
MSTTFFKKCNICLCDIKFNKKAKLDCKHTFHAKCIAALADKKCPVCKTKIFNRYEQKLFKGTAEYDFSKFTFDEALNLLEEAIERGVLELINILLKLYDPSLLMMKYIETGNVKGVEILMKSKHLNYHATKNNKTILDMANESNNDEIKRLLNLKTSIVDRVSLYPRI